MRSFEFSLVLRRTEPPEVDGSFHGFVVLPDTEERQGTWQGLEGPAPVHFKARGDWEYAREDTDWSLRPRGEEANLLLQLEQLFLRDSFLVSRTLGKYLVIPFQPNLPFLDPLLNKHPDGLFTIRRDRILPESITVRSADRTVFWQVKFAGYEDQLKGRKVERSKGQAPPVSAIQFPFVPKWRVVFRSDSGPLDTTTAMRLASRFSAFGYQSQIQTAGDSAAILLERDISDGRLRLMSHAGRLQLWIGRSNQGKADRFGARNQEAAGMPKPATAWEDTTRRFVLERLILERADFPEIAATESAGSVFLTLSLSRKDRDDVDKLSSLEGSGSLWLLTIDGQVVAYVVIEPRFDPEHIALEAVGKRELAEDIAVFSRTPTLARGLRVAGKSAARPLENPER